MCKKENPIPGKIIAVTNRSLCERPFFEQIKRVCETKPAALILREKDLPETEYEEMARQVLAICEEYGVICILHSYIETAKRLERQYVHLPLPLLRTCMQKTENEEKQTAGHIFATDCKRGLPPRGMEFLKQVCETVNIPVYAIGGIGLNDGKIDSVCECGAAGACIMSAFMAI